MPGMIPSSTTRQSHRNGTAGREGGGPSASTIRGPRPRLWGRRSECGVLDGLLEELRAGNSSVLVLRGEAGVGKTALLEYLLDHAAGCRVARAAGVESEMELAYAGLHQLCAPILERLERLPAPQRDALRRRSGCGRAAPDRFLVGLAVLSLLSRWPRNDPCSASWTMPSGWTGVDAGAGVRRAPSAAESVALVFACAAGPDEDDLTGLPGASSGWPPRRPRAPRRRYAGPLDERVRDRIVAETRGNPLALLELPRGLTPAELAAGSGRRTRWRSSCRIEETLPAPLDAPAAADAAAAPGRGGGAGRRPAAVWRAAERLGIDSRRRRRRTRRV